MQPFGRNRYRLRIGWGCAPLGEGELGPYLTHCGQCRGLPACRVSSSYVQPFGHITPTSQTHRQTDRQTGQRSDSMGQRAPPIFGRAAITHSYALLCRTAPSSMACRSVCRSDSLSHKWPFEPSTVLWAFRTIQPSSFYCY